MKTASFATSFALAATLLAGTAMAQTTTAPGTAPTRPTPGNTAPGATSNAPMPGVNSNTGVTPSTGMTDRNSGTAAAAGDRNQGVATTSANAPQPARGRNSFSEGEARRRIERNGYQNVMGLKKDNAGVWRGNAMKDGQSEAVWLDYKGNVGPHPTPVNTRSTPAAGASRPMGAGTTGATPGATGGMSGGSMSGTGTTPGAGAAGRTP